MVTSVTCSKTTRRTLPVYSIAAGLDYPGVGPEHSYYKDIGRAEYVTVTDQEAIDAFLKLAKTEGIIPAIESSHAVAYGMKLAAELDPDKIIIINLSGGVTRMWRRSPEFSGNNISP